MSNPFKKITNNAETSKNKMYSNEELTASKASATQCKSCGAPRPINSNLEKCDYCGLPFMENVHNLKADS